MIIGLLIGFIGGLLGIFYRNCLKVENMIFHKLYTKVLVPMKESKYSIISFISYPLGYCIYCSTTWITFILYGIYVMSIPMPSIYEIILGVVSATGVQHLVICIACRWLINKHPDFE